jgi:hypothetical protein
LLSKQFGHLVGAGIGYVILTTRLPTTELELALTLILVKPVLYFSSICFLQRGCDITRGESDVRGYFLLGEKKGER